MAWLELHKKQVVAGAVVVLCLIVAAYTWNWMRERAELQASRDLLALRAVPGRNQDRPAAAGSDFIKVAEEHASTRAAGRALLLAAGRLFEDGKYAEAQTKFAAALDQDRRGLFAPIAALGVASALDAQDKAEPAMEAYRTVITDYPDDPAADRARLALARLLEDKNQPAEALKLYDAMTAQRSPGALMSEASTRRLALLKKHPALAPTNAAPPLLAPTNPPVATPAAPAPPR